MAHFAEINENNEVLRVIVVHNEDCLNQNGNECELTGIAFCQNLLGGNWIQTSYNGNFRVRYAGIGMTYNLALDAFIPPKPYPSWILDESTANWVAPVPMPEDARSPSNPDGVLYGWDEAIGNWTIFEDLN